MWPRGNCAGTPRPSHRRAAVTGFYSADCVLRNEQQRRAVAVVFCVLFLCVLQWLRTARAKLIAWSAYRSGGLSYVPDQAVQLAAGGSCARGNRCDSPLRSFTNTSRRAGTVAFAALISCAAIPVCSWMRWRKSRSRDLTGSTAKIGLLGWTRKLFGDWWQHPIFTPRGVWIFWNGLIRELSGAGKSSWDSQPLRWRGADGFYALSSLLFLAAVTVGLRKQAGLLAFERQAIGSATLIFLAGVAFLALLSIQFDFGNDINRYAGIYYVWPIAKRRADSVCCCLCVWRLRVCYLFNTALPLIVLGLIVVFVTTSKYFLMNRVVFLSEHNWFHL